MWTIALAALVVGDQALKGRLPDEISGRGVRYASREELDDASDQAANADTDLLDRVLAVEDRLDHIMRSADKRLRGMPHGSRIEP